MVETKYSDEQREQVEHLVSYQDNWGLRNYGALGIGLGNDLRKLSLSGVRAFYEYPNYEVNQVDEIIARLITSLTEQSDENVREEYFSTIGENSFSISYLANLVGEYIDNKK